MSATRSSHPSHAVPARAILSALLVAISAILLIAGPATAAPAVTREEVFKQLGVDDVPSDYIVLVDTSGSMAADGRYSNVRGALGSFLPGLAPSDYVALYTFDAAPQRRYAGRAGDRGAILNALPTGPTPGGKTDIGTGIEQALNELNRSGAADIATIVLLTDGVQQAPAGSAYRSTSGPAWDELKARAQSLKKTWLGAYALPLSAKTGAPLLQKIIPGTVVLQPSNGPALAGYLDQSKQATRLAKARSLLSDDTGKGVQVTWTATQPDPVNGTATLQADLTSLTSRVPITVSNLRITARDGVTWSETPPASVTLQPGRSQRFTFTTRWSPGFSLALWPHTATVSTPLVLTGTAGSLWTQALAPDIALKVPASIANTGTVHMSKSAGSWLTTDIVGGALVLIILTALGIIYTRRWPVLPRGTIGVYQIGVLAGDGAQRADQFTVRRRRARHRSPAIGATFRVRGRRVPSSKFAPEHIGLEITLMRRDIRGTAVHTIRPGQGGLVGGLYLQHVARGGDVPARLRINEDPAPDATGSPWAVPVSRTAEDDDYRRDAHEEANVWSDVDD